MNTKNIKAFGYGIGALFVGAFLMAGVVRGLVGSMSEPDFHEHANFAVFVNGEQFDFAKDQYMHVKPCISALPWWQELVLGQSAYAHDELITGTETADWIHMHDMNGGVIHVHQEGLTYADFFTGLEMELTLTYFLDDAGNRFETNAENELRFFVNKEEVADLPTREVRDLDSVLITYGSVDRDQATIDAELAQIQSDACISSGLCDHRGVPVVENCGAAATTPWLLKWLGIGE